MKKAFLLTLITIIIGGLLLTGCSSPEDTTTSTAPTTTTTTTTTSATPTPQEPIELTFGGTYMPGIVWGEGQDKWMDAIEADTNGRVIFERTWSGTLINETEGMSQIADGVADCGHIDLALKTHGNDLYNAMQIFFFPINDMEISMQIYNELVEKYPEIGEETSEVKVLGASVIPPGQLMTKEPIRSLADLSGTQISGGSNHVEFFKLFNSNILAIEVADVITGIQKGTVDGTMLPIDALFALGLQDTVSYITMLNWGYVPFQIIGMNWDTWNSLPADIQQIFEDNMDTANEAMFAWFGGAIEMAYQVAEESNIELIELSAEDRETLIESFDTLATQTAADLDAKGLPGTAMLNDINALMEKYGIK